MVVGAAPCSIAAALAPHCPCTTPSGARIKSHIFTHESPLAESGAAADAAWSAAVARALCLLRKAGRGATDALQHANERAPPPPRLLCLKAAPDAPPQYLVSWSSDESAGCAAILSACCVRVRLVYSTVRCGPAVSPLSLSSHQRHLLLLNPDSAPGVHERSVLGAALPFYGCRSAAL